MFIARNFFYKKTHPSPPACPPAWFLSVAPAPVKRAENPVMLSFSTNKKSQSAVSSVILFSYNSESE